MNNSDGLVYIIDDDASVRRSLKRLLRSGGLDVETYGSATEFLHHQRPERPACLVLDVRIPGLSGLELQQKLSLAGQSIPIIFITGHGTIPMGVRAMKGGAVDFLQKPFDEQELLDAVHHALELDRKTRNKGHKVAQLQRQLESLTPREREVLSWVVTGRMNKEIALALGTSEETIKVHRARVMQKMRADSLASLVRLADKAGIKLADAVQSG